jgi:flagellar biosynthetic protein FliO
MMMYLARLMAVGIPWALLPFCAWGTPADSSGAPGYVPLQDSALAEGLPDTYAVLARLGLSLLAVILVICGALLLLRRVTRRGRSGPGGSRIRVLERSFIAPKKAVYVIQVGNRTLAVGVSDSQMSTLAELDPDETLAAYPPVQARTGPVSFSSLFDSVRSRFAGADVPGAAS